MGFTATQPSYSGDGISIWEGKVENGDNTGQTYLKVKVLGGKSIACFKVKKKENQKEE